MFRILVSDDIGAHGIDILQGADDTVCDVKTGLSPDELIAVIGEYDALIVRSATKVTGAVLDAASKLKIIGRAGMGVDNIDVTAATQRGVIVMNTPSANSVATAEQTMALMLAATRHTAIAHQTVAEGRWERSKYAGTELSGKTLGIVGFGRIGRLVAARAKAFDMDVMAFDPYVSEEIAQDTGVTLVNLDDLLSRSDYITLHVPSSPATDNLISTDSIAAMKDGVVIINAARGTLIDEAALAEALKSGKVRAAGIDVYRTEPPAKDNPLIGLPNVVHTPHLGASTAEAQRDVSAQIAAQVIDALDGTDIRNPVNLPFEAGPKFAEAMPYMALADKLGVLQFHMAPAPIRRIEIEVRGDVAEKLTRPIAAALLAGLLRNLLAGDINYVNAPLLAEQHGITVSQAKGVASAEYTNLVSCRVHWDDGSRIMAGVLFGGSEPRLVQVSGYHLDVDPTGLLLIMLNKDVPGVIGMVGTTLGRFGVNIAEWRLGRSEPGTEALSFINLDAEPPAEAIEALRSEAAIEKLLLLSL
ncbi:MAG: phosphoglycerate dehydrogenase [Acidimicrobiia bacterium]|nr:MAG: phosphoglycerate dehydrogenase [Acidimicrobiia bacterium]